LFPGRLDLGIPTLSIEIDFPKLNEIVLSYSMRCNQIVLNHKTQLFSKIQNLKNRLDKESIIIEIEKLYGEGAKTIIENFDQYFERIQMYKNTVLTRNTKETIEKLRIGTQLDELDDDFPEEYMKKRKDQAIAEVYFPNETKINTYRLNLQQIDSALALFKLNLESLKIQQERYSEKLQKELVELSSFLSDIVERVESRVTANYQDVLAKAVEDYTKSYKIFEIDISTKKTLRKKTILKWILTSGLIFLVGYCCLRFWKIVTPSNVIIDILTGLIVMVIGNLIGWGFASFKTDVKKIILKDAEVFQREWHTRLLEMFGEEFWQSTTKLAIDEKYGGHVQTLSQIFKVKVDPLILEINDHNQNLLNQMKVYYGNFTEIVNSYNNLVEDFKNNFNGIFSDPEKNLAKIGDITRSIKAKAIEPSFDLLHTTQADLENVKAQIDNI